ncbi:Mrp/NBP35 family ATP-binding protein [Mobiluncus sp.]|uniref:Mrp/NBP35 family ATP-binding protein n=1 Tax=Mobiluncus sp. TaxID=47293 RepID=UPI002A90D4CB|nr:Mrp/NBP35 family ATP-binding protein [Mobiluncus sp.]MDY6077157.1 Mrp/NBP35 family ATP-binding protein [Mobiluncus sp.]
MTLPTTDELMKALEKVIDPEIRRSITDLDMVQELKIDESGHVFVRIALTIAGCPLQAQIEQDAKARLAEVPGVTSVEVEMGVMSREELDRVKEKLLGARPVIPFTQPDSLTRVYAITSGKGGVGKSSVTANLAAAMADSGLKVAVLDCDIYGFSIPRMLGLEDAAPTPVGDMMMPPTAHGVKVISMGMFVPDGQPVVWRGPMLHRALEQFLSETFWGDLDVLLLDLPPGTGDVAISVAQLLPNSEIVVVTTPQLAAAEVAERAGSIASGTNQKVVGVIENMSYLTGPDGSRIEVFGTGGGEQVASRLSQILGYEVPLLAQIPLEVAYREASDGGEPLSTSESAKNGQSVAGAALRSAAATLSKRARSLKGHRLNVTVK